MNYKSTFSYQSFMNSNYISYKHKNYFHIYDQIFSKYRNKKITFLEIGVFSGGSLFMWEKFFGKKAKIIGVDSNPDTKKFEKYGFKIFNGDQSKEIFWKKLFEKVGKVDIVLDDGGHTNYQQIITTNCCSPYIKDNGLLVIEDVHASFIKKKFYNPSKYSYINYCKKIIEDINTRFPGIKKKKFSLNSYIYSSEFFESIVCHKINRKLCLENEEINNKKKNLNYKELRYKLDKNSFFYKIKKLFKLNTNFTYLFFLINSIKSKKFFK